MYIKYVHVLACCWLLLVVSYFSLYSQFCSLLGSIFGFILGLSWSCLKMVMLQVVSFFNGKMVVNRWISGFTPKKYTNCLVIGCTQWSTPCYNSFLREITGFTHQNDELQHITTSILRFIIGYTAFVFTCHLLICNEWIMGFPTCIIGFPNDWVINHWLAYYFLSISC